MLKFETLQEVAEGKMQLENIQPLAQTFFLSQRYWDWKPIGKFQLFQNKILFFAVAAKNFTGYVLLSVNQDDLFDINLVNTDGTANSLHGDFFTEGLIDALDTILTKN